MNLRFPSDRRGTRTALAAAVAAVALAAVAGPAAVHAQKGRDVAAGARGAIQGYVYLDANGDGAFGPSESAVAGVPIRLLGPEGADAASTDVRGLYQFSGLGPGTYAVAIDTTALAVLLGSADGLDVPGYDALSVSGTTLTGVNFALDAAQVSRLATALAKAVAAVQAALPAGATTAMTSTGAAAVQGVTVTERATTTTGAAATEPMTATAAATATTAATMTRGVKGGRQLSAAAAAMTTTTSASGAVTTTAAARVVTATAAITTAAAMTAGKMAGARAAVSASSGGPAAMPTGGLADLFGPGALAAIAGLLSVLGGVGALRRRR